ncbi:hypothetical protein [Streptomyces venezuelae]|nr:hypothetical protein [Streptomyces venezuelae]
MDEAERERQTRGVEGIAPVLRLAGVDEEEDDPAEWNVIRGID